MLYLLLWLSAEAVRKPDHVLHVGLDLSGESLQVVAATVSGRPVFEPSYLRYEVRFRAGNAGHLALADEEETVIQKPLMPDNLADAADVGGAGRCVRVDDPKAEVGLEERMYHYPAPKLEDLRWEDCSGEAGKGGSSTTSEEDGDLQCGVSPRTRRRSTEGGSRAAATATGGDLGGMCQRLLRRAGTSGRGKRRESLWRREHWRRACCGREREE